jgi:hypothetical protein
LEHKVLGKTIRVPLHRFVEIERRDSLQHRQVTIQHHLVAPDEKNGALNTLAEDYISH